MQTIHKYQIEIKNLQRLAMPKGAEILCVQMQNNIPCIWAKVETENDNELRFIEIFGTGHKIDGNNERKYIGTIQISVGNLVFHVFELLK